MRSARTREGTSRSALLDLPLRFERPEDLVDQPRQAFEDRLVPELADKLQLLQSQDGVAGPPQPLDRRQVGARLPGQSGLDPVEHGRNAFLEPTQEAVAERDREEQRPRPRLVLGAMLRGGMGDEGRPIIECAETVVGAGDDPLGEDDERPARFGQQLDGGPDGRAIEPLPVDAERADPPQEPRLAPPAHEQVPARHRVERGARLGPEHRDHRRVARPAVIGGEQHAGACRSADRSDSMPTISTVVTPQIFARNGRSSGRNTAGQNPQRTGGTNR